jgi:hypothetical protein
MYVPSAVLPKELFLNEVKNILQENSINLSENEIENLLEKANNDAVIRNKENQIKERDFNLTLNNEQAILEIKKELISDEGNQREITIDFYHINKYSVSWQLLIKLNIYSEKDLSKIKKQKHSLINVTFSLNKDNFEEDIKPLINANEWNFIHLNNRKNPINSKKHIEISHNSAEYGKDLYWHNLGRYQDVYDGLSEKRPTFGLTENSYLNLVITFGNLYYDLYNNGLCNKDLKLPDAQEYLTIFKEQIINRLEDKKIFTAVHNGSHHYSGYNKIMDAILELYINKEVQIEF